MNHLKRFLLWIILSLSLLGAGGFVIWAQTPSGPMDESLAALRSDEQVVIEQAEWIVFRPAEGQPNVGFIFYPGGRVDARSYAPAARAIASQGYLVVITPMPLNLAVFAPGRAAEVVAAFPHIQHWAVGGHSLGGAMAANFARSNPALVQGLVLWAAYPASGDDLSQQSLAVTSIYGTLDGLADGEKIVASRPLLPADTHWVALEGGNHAQFGWYGEQSGDNPAAISRSEQQAQIVAATLALLQEIGSGIKQ